MLRENRLKRLLEEEKPVVDLSQSYGVPGQRQHAQVQAAIGRVALACERRAVRFCAIPRMTDQSRRWRADRQDEMDCQMTSQSRSGK